MSPSDESLRALKAMYDKVVTERETSMQAGRILRDKLTALDTRMTSELSQFQRHYEAIDGIQVRADETSMAVVQAREAIECIQDGLGSLEPELMGLREREEERETLLAERESALEECLDKVKALEAEREALLATAQKGEAEREREVADLTHERERERDRREGAERERDAAKAETEAERQRGRDAAKAAADVLKRETSILRTQLETSAAMHTQAQQEGKEALAAALAQCASDLSAAVDTERQRGVDKAEAQLAEYRRERDVSDAAAQSARDQADRDRQAEWEREVSTLRASLDAMTQEREEEAQKNSSLLSDLSSVQTTLRDTTRREQQAQ
ncbi:hypothetical protein KIPB_008873, partial [Kipferlia bialata]|eukprot:g8873.t1